MVVAQAVLATPIITALTHRAVEEPWQQYGGALRVDGATRLRSIRMLLAIARRSVLTAVLAGFGRTISEVGAVLIVGGNIAGYTRTMTTTIVLKTSEGELGLALGLGFILIRNQRRGERRRFCPLGESMELRRFLPMLFVALLSHESTAAEQPAPQSITLASTTSVENSGLLAHILSAFTRETGITVHVLAQGTGQALQTAARDDADLLLVHDPEAEEKFIAAGDGIERRQIAWNDFIVVGPRSDPAHVAGGRDAVAALTAIAAAEAPFVSRGDKSGTDALEHRLWRVTGIRSDQGRRRIMVSRYRRRHGCGAQRRPSDARLHHQRSRHLVELWQQGRSRRVSRRGPASIEPLRRDPAQPR
jgi:hypothetical protein